MLSYHDELWHISWGEQDAIDALKAEMSKSCQHPCQPHRTPLRAHSVPWESREGWAGAAQPSQRTPLAAAPSFQPSASSFQPVGMIMTRIPGVEGEFPAMVYEVQQQPQPALPVPAEEVAPLAAPVVCDDPLEMGLTRETFEGELPSVGSEGHFDGSCKRCAFFSKGRCKNGKDCTHCHFGHEPRTRLRKRNAVKGRKVKEEAEEEEDYSAQMEEPVHEEICFGDFPPLPESTSAGATSAPPVEDSCESSFNTATEDVPAEVASKEELAKASIAKFNSAIEEVARAYACGPDAKDKRRDTLDSETTPSVSALSDDKAASEETSDSEVASSQGCPVVSTTSVNEQSHQKNPSLCLSSSPTSWRTMHQSRRSPSSEEDSTTNVERMTRSLLNKLTAERFESLSSKILDLPFSTEEHLAVAAAEIFEKATTQNCFRNLYTDLCMRLDEHLAKQPGAIGGKAFRRALVAECQATFERNLKPADEAIFEGLEGEERFEVEMKLKTRRLGNMRFIGDLLVRRLLAPKLLPPIVHELLTGNEDSLESLIALLMVVAPEFEKKTSLYQAPIRDAFGVLRRKSTDKGVCSRMRCQISDLFDARARDWAPRAACA